MNWMKRHPRTVAVLLDCARRVAIGAAIGLALSYVFKCVGTK